MTNVRFPSIDDYNDPEIHAESQRSDPFSAPANPSFSRFERLRAGAYGM